MTDQEQIDEMASDMDYGCTKRDLYPDDAKEIAKALYLLGYRKLPKDSVVLSREEYKRITTELVTEQRATEIAKEYFEKIRKETAEKILQPLYNACKEDTYGQVVVDFAILENLAKQFGVEIKE